MLGKLSIINNDELASLRVVESIALGVLGVSDENSLSTVSI